MEVGISREGFQERGGCRLGKRSFGLSAGPCLQLITFLRFFDSTLVNLLDPRIFSLGPIFRCSCVRTVFVPKPYEGNKASVRGYSTFQSVPSLRPVSYLRRVAETIGGSYYLLPLSV